MTPPLHEAAAELQAGATASSVQYTVRLWRSQWQFTAAADQTLLLAAEQAGLSWLSSCRNGTCRTCICKLVQGRVSYTIAWPGLSPEEKGDGFILPCVALPASDLVIAQPDTVAPPPASSAPVTG